MVKDQQKKPMLQVKTNCRKEVDAVAEPVSPTGQYFSSKSLSVCVLGVLESAVPIDIDDSSLMQLLTDVYLPINPRFSSIMVCDKKGTKRWKRVEVNLQEHVKVPSFQENLSLETYDEIFDDYLTKIGMNPLPQDRPLWEIHITKYPTSKAAGHVIFKLHHALGDGYSLMGALLSCLQRADNPSLPLTFPSTRSSSKAKSSKTNNLISCLTRTFNVIHGATYDFGWSFMKSACLTDSKTPIRSGNGGEASNPVKISTVAVSLDQLKQVKEKLGVTVNAIITGIVSFGAGLYMQSNGTGLSKSNSTALILLNTRNTSGYMSVQEMLKAESKIWGNHFAFLHVALPKLTTSKASNPLNFVREAQETIQRKRISPAVFLTGQYLELVRKCRGPEAAARHIKSTLRRSSLGITSLIGPIEKMALANHPVKGLYFMPIGVCQSLVITVISYAQTVRIGIGVEKGFIDSQKFTSCIENAFELILEAAKKLD